MLRYSNSIKRSSSRHNENQQQSIIYSIVPVLIATALFNSVKVYGQDVTAKRVSTVNTFNLKCQIGNDLSSKGRQTIKNVDFEYWYAIGSIGEIDLIKMFNIEQLLYNNVEDDMVWCWEEIDDNEAVPTTTTTTTSAGTITTTTTRSDGRRRNQDSPFMAGITEQRQYEQHILHQKQQKQQHIAVLPSSFKRRATAEQARVLGIITFTPGTMDKETSLRCPSILDNLINATGTTDCMVVHGTMRIIAHTDDDLTYATAAIRDGLQGAMTAGLGQQNEISGIKFLSYLGDTEDDVLALITSGRPGSVVGEEGSGSNGSEIPTKDGSNGTGETVVSDVRESESTGDDDNGMVILFAVGIPVLVAFLIAALLHRKERNVVTASTYYGLKDHEYILPGTADPPGHFHEGLYHYMKNGQSYLSTNCELCYETRRQMMLRNMNEMNGIYDLHDFDSDSASIDEDGSRPNDANNLATILENEPYDTSSFDEVLVRPDPDKSLTQLHMGLDVHKCTSSTCTRCDKNGLTNQLPTFLSRLNGTATDAGNTKESKPGSQIVFSNSVFSDHCGEV